MKNDFDLLKVQVNTVIKDLTKLRGSFFEDQTRNRSYLEEMNTSLQLKIEE